MRRSSIAVLLLVASCSSTGSSPGTSAPDAGDTRPPTPAEWDRAVTRPDEAAARASRAACTFQRGALADETLGKEIPVGKDLPLDVIVVLMQENRSFDHYFGHFAGADGAPEAAQNPDSTGAPVAWSHAEHLCFSDTDHEWDSVHRQYDDAKMDGFAITNEPNPQRAMSFYDERDLPYYYALARSFAIGDRAFSSLLGPTWPNRMFLTAGTAFGITHQNFPDATLYPFPDKDMIVFDELEKRHVDWKLYTDGGPPGATVVVGLTLGQRWGKNPTFRIEDFEADAAAGKLPAVAFVDANFVQTADPAGETEHPPSDVQVGQAFVARIVTALTRSPQWARSALFLTYDEHGGIYDHVPPPAACVPDDASKDFDRYGVRVPLVVVSPFAKRGFVSHETYDHTSILRLIEARHRVPALTARDANAMIPIDVFDFAGAPNLAPPALPDATVDPAELAYCRATFGK